MGMRKIEDIYQAIIDNQELIDMWTEIYKKAKIDQKEEVYLQHCIETINYLKGQNKALKWVADEI